VGADTTPESSTTAAIPATTAQAQGAPQFSQRTKLFANDGNKKKIAIGRYDARPRVGLVWALFAMAGRFSTTSPASDDGRPRDCDCGAWNADTELPCWPCYRDGHDEPPLS
jgi:hypothetical protein